MWRRSSISESMSRSGTSVSSIFRLIRCFEGIQGSNRYWGWSRLCCFRRNKSCSWKIALCSSLLSLDAQAKNSPPAFRKARQESTFLTILTVSYQRVKILRTKISKSRWEVWSSSSSTKIQTTITCLLNLKKYCELLQQLKVCSRSKGTFIT